MFSPFAILRRWLGGGRGRAGAHTRVWQEGSRWVIDVRGQTCPGYLLEIDRAVARIGPGERVELRISYPPCADDVRVWCAEKGHALHGIDAVEGGWFSIMITCGEGAAGKRG